MVDLTCARGIAVKFVQHISRNLSDRVVVDDDYTVESSSGWFFSYNNEKFIKTRDIEFMLLGNHPLFVDLNGDVWSLLPYVSVDDFLDAYRMGGSLDKVALRVAI